MDVTSDSQTCLETGVASFANSSFRCAASQANPLCVAWVLLSWLAVPWLSSVSLSEPLILARKADIRSTKSKPVPGPHLVYGFLTTPPNSIVEPIHPKAMPVILTTPEEWDSGCARRGRRQNPCNGHCRTTRWP